MIYSVKYLLPSIMSVAAQLLNVQWKLANAKPGPITEWKRVVLMNKFRGKAARLSTHSEICKQSNAIYEERHRITKAHSQTLCQRQMLKQNYTELKKEQADLDSSKAQLAQNQAAFAREQEDYMQELKKFKEDCATFDKSRLAFSQIKYDIRMLNLEYRERNLAKRETEAAISREDLIKQRLEFDEILTLQIANQQVFKEEQRRFNKEKEAFRQAPNLATSQPESLVTTQPESLATTQPESLATTQPESLAPQALQERYLSLTRQILRETSNAKSVAKHSNSK